MRTRLPHAALLGGLLAVAATANAGELQQDAPAAAGPPAASPASPAAPGSLTEAITVTATRTEEHLGDTAASVVLLDSQEVTASAAPTIDDILRQIPGFSLFRRTGSRYANPTTQGVSLRGFASSGASRTVVLEDGVRLNDPFGSWVYWGRVPLVEVERLEVLRGAASELYGSGAMAGVIQVITRPRKQAQVLADASYGNERSGNASTFASDRRGTWQGSAAAESFGTAGYVAIAPAVRGPIDTPVNAAYTSGQGTVERIAPDSGRLFARGGYYGESRDNGTPAQTNDTEIKDWTAGGDWQPWNGSLSLRTNGSTQGFFQTFSAVAPNRESETLTRAEKDPVRSLGLSSQATMAAGGEQSLVAGGDLAQVNATTRSTGFLASGGATQSELAARQRTGGLFLEDLWSASSRLSLELGVRGDLWRDNTEQEGAKPASPAGERSAWSPRLGAVLRATDSLRLSLSAYRAFRAPTLNELYRGFRVGNTVTLANPDLDAERLSGGEGGALWSALGGRLTARAVAFWMEIDHPVANVTLTATPALITRERENLGRTRSRGAEAEISWRPAPLLTLAGGFEWVDATVVSFPEEPALVGKRLPEVPRTSTSLTIVDDLPRFATLALQARYASPQFDDDLNQLRLASWTDVDATIARPLAGGFSLSVAGENLFGTRAQVARTPLLTLGAPRLVRIGLHYQRPPAG